MIPDELDAFDVSNAKQINIDVDRVVRNPSNPRILFRQEEMDDLLDSIKKFGVLVPISVYKQGGKYVLIDGERRWRCCLKLNRKQIPAYLQQKPDPLTNMLLMFNIHALREQWDLLTIALKLREVISLLEAKLQKRPTEKDVSERTGLKISVIRRCNLLLALPSRYHEMILNELHKPKSQQKLTEDFFIEMEKALKSVERAMPEVIASKDDVRRTLIAKFRKGVIDNRVSFRKVAKIARAERVGADAEQAEAALHSLFERNDYGIEEAFEDSVSEAYSGRDFENRLRTLIERLRGLESEDIDEEAREYLREVVQEANRLLEGE